MARFFRSERTRPISQFVPLPLDFFRNKINLRQKQRDKLSSAANIPADFKINSISRTFGSDEIARDRLLHQELNKESQRRADEAIKLLTSGDDLRKVERKLLEYNKWKQQQLSPIGDAYKINQRYKEKMEFYKKVDKAKLGKVGEDIKKRADFDYRSQGYIGNLSENLSYPSLNIPEFFDREKLARNIATDIPAIAKKLGYTEDLGNGIWRDVTDNKEMRTDDMIAEALIKGLISNEKYKDYTETLIQNKAFNEMLRSRRPVNEGGLGLSVEDSKILFKEILDNERSYGENSLQRSLIDYGTSFRINKTEDKFKLRKSPFTDESGRPSTLKNIYTSSSGAVFSKNVKASSILESNEALDNTINEYKNKLNKLDITSREYQLTKDKLNAAKSSKYYGEMALIAGLNKKGVDINRTANKILSNPKYLRLLYGRDDFSGDELPKLRENIKRDLLNQGALLIDKLGDALWAIELKTKKADSYVAGSNSLGNIARNPNKYLSIWGLKSDLKKELGNYDLDFDTKINIDVTQVTGNKNTYLNEEKGNIKELLKTSQIMNDYLTGEGFEYNDKTDDFNVVDVTDSGKTMLQIKRKADEDNESRVVLVSLPGGFTNSLANIGFNMRKNLESNSKYYRTSETTESSIGLANRMMANSYFNRELDLHPIKNIPAGSKAPFKGIVVGAEEDSLGNRYYTINGLENENGIPLEFDSEPAVLESLGNIYYKQLTN